MSIKYTVLVGDFAERHYLKKFEKKYKKNWQIVFRFLKEEFKRSDNLIKKVRVPLVLGTDKYGIYKRDFKVLSKESAKDSGNRCLFLLDKQHEIITILLVYHKNYLGRNETSEWKRLIKEGYPDIAKEFNL